MGDNHTVIVKRCSATSKKVYLIIIIIIIIIIIMYLLITHLKISMRLQKYYIHIYIL